MPKSIYKGPDEGIRPEAEELNYRVIQLVRELLVLAQVQGFSLREVANLIAAEAAVQANRQILVNRHGILKNPG